MDFDNLGTSLTEQAPVDMSIDNSRSNIMMNMTMNTSMNQTLMQERNVTIKLSSFLEEREVPIVTSLEPFYPKDAAVKRESHGQE